MEKGSIAIISLSLILGLTLPGMVNAEVQFSETPPALLEQLFEEYNLMLIENPARVYYVELIAKHIDLLELDEPGHRTTYLSELQTVIGSAKTVNWDEVIQALEGTLIPHAAAWVTNEAHKEIVTDLLTLQKYAYEQQADYIGVPKTFEATVKDAIIDNNPRLLLGFKIHFSNCFTIDSMHIKDCSTIVIT